MNSAHNALTLISETLANGNWFDAILSDFNMPRMNGLELLMEIRDLKIEIPFVFLTGFADKEKVIQAMRLGAMDFLEKPCPDNLLIETVTKAANLGRAMKTLEFEIRKSLHLDGVTSERGAEILEAARAIQRIKGVTKTYFDKKD